MSTVRCWLTVGIVVMVLLQSVAGIAAAGTAVPGEELVPPPVDLCQIETPNSVALSTAQEDRCAELIRARDEADAEWKRLSDEKLAIHRAQSERQDELVAECPEDLSIIKCVGDSVESSRLEYEDELARVTAEEEAALEKARALQSEVFRCREATATGADYTPPVGLLDEAGAADDRETTPETGERSDDDDSESGAAVPIDDGDAEQIDTSTPLFEILGTIAAAIGQELGNQFWFFVGVAEGAVEFFGNLAASLWAVVSDPWRAATEFWAGITAANERGGIGAVLSLFDPTAVIWPAIPELLEAYRTGDFREAGRQYAKIGEGIVSTVAAVATAGAGVVAAKAAAKRGIKLRPKAQPNAKSGSHAKASSPASTKSARESAGPPSQPGGDADKFLNGVRGRANEAKILEERGQAIKKAYEEMSDVHNQATSERVDGETGASPDTGDGDAEKRTFTARVVKTPDDVVDGDTGDGPGKSP